MKPVTQSTNQPSFDPVSLEIMWSRLVNITEECWITIRKTAFSLIIGEAQDFGCELLDPQGESLAHSPRSMPVFNLTLPRAVKALLDAFPPEDLQEGDVLITNDPWLCAGHLFDVALVTPVFREGKLVGHIGSIAHCSDIGGTLDANSAREIYDEGLQIPPMKLYKAGQPNDDLINLIKRNVRKGEMVMGDIQAQYSANEVGAERLSRFMDEYALEDLSELAEVIQDRAEDAMRHAIAAVPDGSYKSSITYDGIGDPLTLHVTVTISGDELSVDWDAPPQLSRGGINCTLNYTAAHSVYALKSMLTPDIPSNAGCYRPITVSAPAGSILNCDYPASVNVRTMTGWYCGPALFKAMQDAIPDQVQAFTGLPMAVGAYGRNDDGKFFNDHLFQGGGQGAGLRTDGKSALLYPTSAANTPVEMFEIRAPMLVEEKALIADSGGVGKQRGGLGQRVKVRKLFDDERPVLLSWHPQGLKMEYTGLQAGNAGRRANLTVEKVDERLEGLKVGSLVELSRAKEHATMDLPGGAGFGRPEERRLEHVQHDFEEGYITEEGLAAYGCRLGENGKVERG